MTAALDVVCIDCIAEGITRRRPIKMVRGLPVAGLRCTTHWRARRAVTRDRAWERYLERTYGITGDEYWAIYEWQGGVCYICERANGKTKKLSVDHDHKTGFVRGLLCSPCNKDVLGHLKDDPKACIRAALYLLRPPAFSVIGERVAPIELIEQLERALDEPNNPDP